MAQQITETLGGAATTTTPGRIKATLITPGVGSSGTYAAEVLRQAADDKIFGRGTQMHINHNSPMDDIERPEGDLRNLAGVLLEDAYWDGTGLVAEARISSAWKDFIEEFGEFIGISISAQAEVTESGEVTRFLPHPFTRADFVTSAGRGGEITEILEAARVIESRSIVASETTESDIEMWLDSALRDRLNGNDGYYYSVDHDHQYVYYRYDDKYYRRSYTLDGSTIMLADDATQVHRRTEYDPVIPATRIDATEKIHAVTGRLWETAKTFDELQDSQPTNPAVATPTNNQQEAAMVEIDAAELKKLQEKAGRADELAAKVKELEEAQATQAAESRKEKALAAVKETFGDDVPTFFVTAAETAAQAEDYDHDAFKAMVEEAATVTGATVAGTPNLGAGVATTTESKTTITTEDIVNVLEGRA